MVQAKTTGNINLTDDTIRLTINDDPARVLEFDPKDVTFAENFFILVGNFENRLNEYKANMQVLTKDKATDGSGIPLNVRARMDLLRETCDYIRAQIDFLFGDGTSQMIFGNAKNLESFTQLFAQITPYVEKVRLVKIEQYTTEAAAKRNRRRIKPKTKKG